MFFIKLLPIEIKYTLTQWKNCKATDLFLLKKTLNFYMNKENGNKLESLDDFNSKDFNRIIFSTNES